MKKQKFIIIALSLALCGCFNNKTNPSWPMVTEGTTNVAPFANNNFGERTPVDRYANNNISSSAPPMYPEENTIYEEFEEDNEDMSTSSNNDYAPQAPNNDDANNEPIEDWLIKEGVSLKNTLQDWANRSGWKLIWKTKRNYKVQAGSMYRGRFVDVSSALIRDFSRATPAPYAVFYKGNRVLVIDTREGENAY